MRTLHLVLLSGVLGAAVAPAALTLTPAVAQAQSQQAPTKQQLETAVRSAKPTIGQLRQLKKLEPQINSMTPDQLKAALGQIFSPGQLTAIHQSLVAQGVSLPG